MGSMSVSSCRWCMFVSCAHPGAALNATFCLTCSLFILVEDERGVHMEEPFIWKSRSYGRAVHMEEAFVLKREAYSRAGPMTAL